MSFLNLRAGLKASRASTLTADLGGTGNVMIYTGAAPLSPDIAVPAANLLCVLPMSSTAGTVAFLVQAASVAAGGSGGTNGTQTVTGTTGTGTKFQASVTVSGGAVTAVLSILVAGSYTAMPANVSAEPVTGAGLTGATLALAMGAVWTANAVTTSNATASGTAGFARLAASNAAGAGGVVDGDVGTTGATFLINTTAITNGSPVVCSSIALTEA